MPSIAQLFVDVGADISGAVSNLGKLDQALRTTASQMRTVGNEVTSVVTAPILGATAAVGLVGIGFESAFVRVRKTVDDATTDLNALEQGIIDLSKSEAAGGKSAEELAKIAEVAGQLGVEGADNILTLTRVVANFSLATGIAADSAATSLERLRTITATPRAEFENLANTIVDLGNRTNATEAEIIAQSERLAGSLHTVGATAPEILGIATALAQVGVDPEAGGTSVSKFFVDMTAAANGAGAALKDNSRPIREMTDHLNDLRASLAGAEANQLKFGRNTSAAQVQANASAIERYKREISEAEADLNKLNSAQTKGSGALDKMASVAGVTTEEFKNLVKTDPTKAFTAIVEGIARIRESEGPAVALQALSDIGVDDVRQRDAILRLSTGAGLLTSSIEIANKAWQDNNASQVEAAKAMQSTENQWNLLINQLKGEFIPMWKNELRPIVLDLMKIFREQVLPVIKDLTGQFAAMTPDQQKNILMWAGIAAAAGPALVVLGAIVGILAGLLSPIGLVIIAVGLLAAAWVTNFGDIQGKTEAVWTFIQDNWRTVLATVTFGVSELVIAFVQNFDSIKGTVGRAFEFIGTALDLQRAIVSRILREIGGFFETFLLPPLRAVGGWIAEHLVSPFLELVKWMQGILTKLFPGGAPGGVDFGSIIAQGEATMKNLTGQLDAGGPGGKTFNAPLVQVNNPVITDQASVDELINRVGSWVTTALVQSEQASFAPALGLPGVPF